MFLELDLDSLANVSLSFIFFFQAEDGIRVWSVTGVQTWCSSDLNVCPRHTKPRKMGDEGGIIQKEGAIYACKVMRVCPKCEKPTRPAHKLLADGKKVRVCKKCGAEI